jgi:hypothetical protein
MQAAVRACGHTFGWGIRGGKLSSDAPSESWHAMFHTGVFKPPPAGAVAHVHPALLMTESERASRDILIKERRVAKVNGGWKGVDPIHRQRAMTAKADLKAAATNIAATASQSGWDKANRKVRYDYINKLTGA